MEENIKIADTSITRNSSLDVMKCFAAFLVVWLHFGNGLLCPIYRCAVPIFFIITGYYYPMMIENFLRHLRKITVMVLGASALYGLISLQYQIRHDTLGEWIADNIRFKHIIDLLIFDEDMFVYHLWYFYAVFYDLLIFYFADKWNMTKWLRYAYPVLLFLFFFMEYLNLPIFYYRNFMFMGLPCMMIGRSIRESNDKPFHFFSKQNYLWIYVIISTLLIGGEGILNYIHSGSPQREMFLFTIPLCLSFFYWALYHPTFGEGTVWATIGRKYSAYIYIFHVFVALLLSHVVDRDASLLTKLVYPFLVFLLSLFLSWLFVKSLEVIKS